jgi:hypothetical protein
MKESNSNDKSHRRDASQYFVAGELCRRGIVAVLTMGNCPNTDILCSNKEGTRFVHIQVKTFVPGNKTCSVGFKAEKDYGENFFWVLGGIPKPKQKAEFEFYIIPSTDMAKNISQAHQNWLQTPGKHGRQHKQTTIRTVHLPPNNNRLGWSIENYKNRWDIIETKLNT